MAMLAGLQVMETVPFRLVICAVRHCDNLDFHNFHCVTTKFHDITSFMTELVPTAYVQQKFQVTQQISSH